ncbi:hypothetical protein ACQ4N7_26400 [Nodosilinea sp. AN01ver1]|uniref:hypothetical protein n=1 Tax=Nodosilinea sp. AN01ver1 TaxID=3423362 RepID=UPI003D312747
MTSTNVVLNAVIQEIEQTPPEYLPNLLQIVRLFRESVTLKTVEAKGEATNNSFEPIPLQGEAISQTLLNERR